MPISGRTCRGLAVAVLLCGFLAVDASAQVTTGNISGTVHDAQGGVVPGRRSR